MLRIMICGFRFIYFKIKYLFAPNIQIAFRQYLGLSTMISADKNSSLVIGERCASNKNVRIKAVNGGVIQIGKRCFFNDNCSITSLGKIEIGEDCSIANNVVMVDHDHNFSKRGDNPFVVGIITIGNNVWIGANCVILKNVSIGDNSVIAAGSVIRESVPPNSMVYQRRITCIKDIERCRK